MAKAWLKASAMAKMAGLKYNMVCEARKLKADHPEMTESRPSARKYIRENVYGEKRGL